MESMSHPLRIQPGFCIGFCASQTLGYSSRKLVTLPNKSVCALISHNSAESNHNSNGNKKLPGSPPQLIPDKYACPGSFLTPIKAPIGFLCNSLQRESQDQVFNLFLLPPSRLLTHTFTLHSSLELLLLKMNVHIFI